MSKTCPACGSTHEGEKWRRDWSKRRCPICPADTGSWYWRDQMIDHLKDDHNLDAGMINAICKELDQRYGPDNSTKKEIRGNDN